MNILENKYRYLVLALLIVLPLLVVGCKGSDGSDGSNGVNGTDGTNGTNGTNGTDGTNGTNGTNGGQVVNINSLNSTEMASLQMTGVITEVTMSTNPVVKFSVTDAGGNGVTGLGTPSASNAANLNYVHVAVASLSTDPTDSTTNAWTNYYLAASNSSPSNEGLVAGLVDNNDGTYQYTFVNPITGAIDVNATHRAVVQVSGTVPNSSPAVVISNPVNIILTFVPSGAAVTDTRDIVSETACNGCHTKIGDTNLDPETGKTFGTPGHGGRIVTKYCVMCHNYQNEVTGLVASTATSTGLLINPSAGGTKHSTWKINNGTNTYNQLEFVTMIHKTHMGSDLALTNYSINADHYFPNTIGYPQDIRNCTTCHVGSDGDNWKTKPTMKACGTCHDNVSFAALANVPTGFVPHASTLAQTGSGSSTDGFSDINDSQCVLCHSPGNVADIEVFHRTPDATTHNPINDGTVPVISYEVAQATVSANQMTVKFRIKKSDDGGVTSSYVTLNTDTTGVLITGLTNTVGPTLMPVYAFSQDGITSPSDWNSGHNSFLLSDIWNGTKGTLTGPDVNNFYTALLSGGTVSPGYLNIPTGAVMVAVAMKDQFRKNGVDIRAKASFVTADGYTARRVIFSETKCNTCHEQLGTVPNFHSGNYNVALCAMCHTPNQSSNGWSASFRVWVHGIHSSGKTGVTRRTVPFTWHAASTTENYTTLEYPGILNNCEQCHLPGTYDFSSSIYTSSVMNNMLNVLVAKGTYTTIGGSGAGNAYKNSPYIDPTGVTNYGTGYSIASDGTKVEGAGANLVSSPITAACSACHDSTTAIAHMRSNGGSFYATRSSATGTLESCLICHGKGTVADIKAVHAY